jgi:hypothetical protein
VDEEAEMEDVAKELPQTAGTGEETDDVHVIAKLGDAVRKEVSLRCAEIAQSLVNELVEGRVQNFKCLLAILEAGETSRAASRKTARRSVARAWGAEPEWKTENCAHCAVRTAA